MANRPSSERIPLFSSTRERRLWMWTLVVVVAIYATLGLTSTLVGILVERGLFNRAFVIAFLTMCLAVLTQGLRVRPGGMEIGVALGVVGVYLMVFARLGIPERSHLFEYSIVAVCIYEALTERASQGRHVPVPALLTILVTTLVGTIDELIQAVLPSRHFAWGDLLFNILAALMATAACVVLGWARRLTKWLLGRVR